MTLFSPFYKWGVSEQVHVQSRLKIPGKTLAWHEALVFIVHSCYACTCSGLLSAVGGSETENVVALLSQTEILLSKILY